MRSSLRRLRGFALHRSEPKEKRERRQPAKLDELVQAAQDIQNLKGCYDSLISAAAATANSAYEFSEALHEMGTCLLENTALNDDEDSGQVSLMLGKAQFELHRLVDNYRAHIIQTITTPSESLLKELQIVEDMKQQCDDKRDLYKVMLTAPRQKGRLRNPRGDSFTPQQLQAAREDFEEESNLFVFRLKSLKQGQSRSLFTQFARHYAAQLNFFRKGLKSLELIESHVKSIAEQQHIDYHFSELDEVDDMDYDVDGGSYHYGSDDGELSFDYGLNEMTDDAFSMHRNSTVINQVDNTTTQASSSGILQENLSRIQADLLNGNQRPSSDSHSAPIFADRNFNFSDKIKRIPPPSTRKFHTYVLPTPLNPQKLPKYGDKNSPSPMSSPKVRTSPKDRNIRNNSAESPASSSQNLFSPQFSSFSTPEAKKIRRYAFSGPITEKTWSSKPSFTPSGFPKIKKLSHTSLSVRISSAASPPRSTLRISELHELPRPPSSSVFSSPLVGHSAPLVSRDQEIQNSGIVFPLASETASSLPAPPAILRTFSIPYRGQRMPYGTLNKLLETPRILELGEEVDSPTLTPLPLKSLP